MTDQLEKARRNLDRLANDVGQELQRVCRQIRYDKLDGLDFADVILGLLARAYQLWVVALLSPGSWTTPVSPLVLRALADSTITTAWLAANPGTAEQYKLYSAGRLKLLAEHWRTRETPETTDFASAYADELTEIVNSERLAAALPVELGSWNDKDIRAMAIETGLKDIYDLAYSPMSAEAHGEWMPLRRRFMRPCTEELHPTHWLPLFERPYRITNHAPTATVSFVVGVSIALDAVNLEFQEEFWHGVEETVRSLVGQLLEEEAKAEEIGAESLTEET